MKEERLITIENQLGTILKPRECVCLARDWHEYYCHPNLYGGVVVSMVKQWVRKIRS